MIGWKLSVQVKVNCTHYVESGVKGPQCHKYLPIGSYVWLHAVRVDGFLVGDQDSHMYLVSEYL